MVDANQTDCATETRSTAPVDLPRDRDASDAIRGYMYQVDLTIERWLALAADEELELECAEDIDRVARHVTAEGVQASRLAEQIKLRSSNVTLRSPDLVEAIANAIDLREANPGRRICFRFTTNARAGVERPTRMPGRRPAIEAWERVRLGQADLSETGAVLSALYRILKRVKRPKDLPDQTWARYRAFFHRENAPALRELIGLFEWSLSAPGADAQPRRLLRQLVERGAARDELAAIEIHRRLFVRLCRVLSSKGRKCITARERDELIAEPTLSADDRALLQRLGTRLDAVEDRIVEVERAAENALTTMQRTLDRLGAAPTPALHETRPVVLEAPLLPAVVVHRRAVVASIGSLAGKGRWIHVTGEVQVGKTCLAALVARGLGECIWVRVGQWDSPTASLDRAIATLAGVHAAAAVSSALYLRACASAASSGRAALVLDAIPAEPSEEFIERLQWIAAGTKACGLFALSTGSGPLPSALVVTLPPGSGSTIRVPPFDTAEVDELLCGHGAPPSSELRLAEFLGTLSHGHPVLLACAIRYLRASSWLVDSDQLRQLLTHEHMRGLDREVVPRLVHTVTDPRSRELIQRLRVSAGPLDAEDIRALAAVLPSIDRVLERTTELSGVWLQDSSGGRYTLSPLLAALGPIDLDPTLEASCHGALADTILRRPSVTIADAMRSIAHYRKGRRHVAAAVTTVRTLAFALSHSASHAVTPLLSGWVEEPLPADLDPGAALMLRTLQVVTAVKTNRSIGPYLPDLDSMYRAPERVHATLLASSAALLVFELTKSDFGRACRYLATALRAAPDGRIGLPGEEPLPAKVGLDALVWVTAADIRSSDDLDAWSSALACLNHDQVSNARQDPQRRVTMWVAADRVWLEEFAKPIEQQRWAPVRESLERLVERALSVGAGLIAAAGTAALITVVSEHMHDLDWAVAHGEASLAHADGPDARFTLREALGRSLLFCGRAEAALPHLLVALRDRSAALPTAQLLALRCAIQAAGSADAQASVGFAAAAVDLVRCTPEIRTTELVAWLAELGLAHWFAGDRRGSLAALDECCERLLDDAPTTVELQVLTVAVQHVVQCIASAALGRPVKQRDGTALTGNIVPAPGFVVSRRADFARDYRIELEGKGALFLAWFARLLGNDAVAAKWALRAVTSARAQNDPVVRTLAMLEVLPSLLNENDFAAALDLALEFGGGSYPEDLRRVFAIKVCATCGALRAARLSLSDPAAGGELASQLSAACRDFDETEEGDASAVADVLDATFSGRSSFGELVERGTAFGRRGVSTAHALAYVGATLQPDAELAKAVPAQLAVAREISRTLALCPPLEIAFADFLCDYWRARFEAGRFAFRSPRRVESALAYVADEQPYDRARRVLDAIATSLDVRPGEIAREWLAGTR